MQEISLALVLVLFIRNINVNMNTSYLVWLFESYQLRRVVRFINSNSIKALYLVQYGSLTKCSESCTCPLLMEVLTPKC
jgi:hypothetical protein